MHETRTQSVGGMLREYVDVAGALLRTPHTMYTGGIMLVLSIAMLISGSFWSILLTEKLLIPAEHLAIFPFIKSAIILGFFFLVMPRISSMHFTMPLVIGFFGYLAAQALLVVAPVQNYPILILSVVLEACSFAAVSPLVDKLLVLTVDPQERARIQSLLYMGVILLTAPFGWIAGSLSSVSKELPFVLSIGLFALGMLLAYLAGRAAERRSLIEGQAG